MKRNFKRYTLIWGIFLAAFSAVMFLVRPMISNYEIRYDVRFWIAYAFVIIAFCGNLLCAKIVLREENLEKLFYKVPIITVSYAGLVGMLVLGGALMMIPNCPVRISVVVCVLISALTAAAAVKANWAGEAVNAVHEKVKDRTNFMKLLTAEAEILLSKAKTPEAKMAAEKVYEAVRYSDPVSSDVLIKIEAELAEKFKVFEAAMDSGEGINEAAEALLKTLARRNRLCREEK